MLLHNNRGGNYVIMNTVRCIYILERKHLLILVNIWLLFIWYICTYAAVMQLCSELRWHCFWSHVVSTVFFFLLIQMTMSILWVLKMHFHPFTFDVLTDSVSGGNGGVKHSLFSCDFWHIPVVFFLLSLCKTHCTQIQGATMISQ